MPAQRRPQPESVRVPGLVVQTIFEQRHRFFELAGLEGQLSADEGNIGPLRFGGSVKGGANLLAGRIGVSALLLDHGAAQVRRGGMGKLIRPFGEQAGGFVEFAAVPGELRQLIEVRC